MPVAAGAEVMVGGGGGGGGSSGGGHEPSRLSWRERPIRAAFSSDCQDAADTALHHQDQARIRVSWLSDAASTIALFQRRLEPTKGQKIR
jgi:hypothetical protein